MAAFVVLRRVNDSFNVLNVINHSGNSELARREANRLAQGWREKYSEHIIIADRKECNECNPVNNTDGFLDLIKDYAEIMRSRSYD